MAFGQLANHNRYTRLTGLVVLAATSRLSAQCPGPGALNESIDLLSVTRVVGPGTADEFDGQGYLRNWSANAGNGVLSAFRYLPISTTFTDSPIPGLDYSGTVRVYINGNLVGATQVSHPEIASYTDCILVSTRFIKFAKRRAFPDGGAPDPVENTVSFEYVSGAPAGQVHFSVGNFQFDATAPIVLVHGFNAGPWVWADNNTECGFNSRKPGDHGEGSINLLKAVKGPFECRVEIDPQASVQEGATILGERLLNIRDSFGVNRIHLVAHSKGGLFSRQFLTDDNALESELYIPGSRIGILSLTTLATPHHGSVLGDWNWAGYTLNTRMFKALQLLPAARSATGPGSFDMRVDEVEKFNVRHPSTPREITFLKPSGEESTVQPRYFSTSADADKNHNGQIDLVTEAPPYNFIEVNWRYRMLLKVRSITLQPDASGKLRAVYTPAPPGTRYLNDSAVTVDSARYVQGGFSEIASYYGSTGRNHAHVRDPAVADLVFAKIRAAEEGRQ